MDTRTSERKKSVKSTADEAKKETNTEEKDMVCPSPCGTCGKLSEDDSEPMVLCDRCEVWFCLDCSKLDIATYNIITDCMDLLWCCPNCKPKALFAMRGDWDIESRCNVYMEQVTTRIVHLETTIETKADKTELCKMKKELLETTVPDITNQILKKVNEQISDVQKTDVHKVINETVQKQNEETIDKEKRKDNLIVFNAIEANTNLKDERIKHDIDIFLEICETICPGKIKKEDILLSIRLGKKEDGHTRPMLTKLVDNNKKREILRNLHKLKDNTDERLNKVKMNHDLTIKEREQSKELQQEAKKKREQDKSGEFTYKVRGPPWDMKILKIKIKRDV